MNSQNWKIFDKKGSYLNLFTDSYLNYEFKSSTGTNAAAFALTDPSGFITGSQVLNSGWKYQESNTQLNLNYLFGTNLSLTYTDASIIWKDVSIFCPDASNSLGVGNVITNLNTSFIYPSLTLTSAIFLKPISQGLVETEHLVFLEQSGTNFIRPYDPVNPNLIFRMEEGDTEIRFFEIDEHTQVVQWSDQIDVSTDDYISNTGIMINIGFRSEDEGVYERKMKVYHRIAETDYLLAEILVNAESIGPDERFDTLITNFGLPSPKATPKLFKEADINEDLPDWELLNQKAKHIILEHDKIMPYIGTYKALINAIKWLGYEDIHVKEWFKNVKDNTMLSLTVPYDAPDRTKTILYFSPEERRNLKKLNQLSLVYCLTRETGEYDDFGVPMTEECYQYNINEILVKLYALKQWLERWIIGVNCRITDITGEGIYIERYKSTIYATQNFQTEANFEYSLTPVTIGTNSELTHGDASILLTLKELSQMPVNSVPLRFSDLISYCWDPSNGAFNLSDASSLSYYDPSTIFVGPSFNTALSGLYDIQWKASIEKDDAGVIGNHLVTNPLFIYENEIRFYNILDTYSKFYDVSTGLNIVLENAYLRDPSIDEWTNSIAYTIYPGNDGYYYMESSSGLISYRFNSYVIFSPDSSSNLVYAVDDNYRVPLLSMENFTCTDSLGNQINPGKKYFLDILDGKIAMDSSTLGSKGEIITVENFINFQYDTSLDEQMITYNLVYRSPRMALEVFDPSMYWYLTVVMKEDPSASKVVDNSTYIMNVNHKGEYLLEVYAWDGYNNIYFNQRNEPYPVWMKYPIINFLIDSSSASGYDSSTSLTISEVNNLIEQNKYPIYDRIIPLQGLEVKIDPSGNSYVEIPSITYFQDVPEPESINRFFNLTERVTSISGTDIIIDNDYQNFYSGDEIRLVKFDKGKYDIIQEVSARIITASGNNPVSATLDYNPFTMDSSWDIYILNDSYRVVSNISNLPQLTLDVSGYQFGVSQVVSLIIKNLSDPRFSWGSSYRVLSVDGSRHVLDGVIPEFFVMNPSRYSIEIKHAFSSYSDFQIETASATESQNKFKVYLQNSYCQEYFLDNTFIFTNILFDQDYVNRQWYNSSDNLISGPFYFFDKSITNDISTLTIFKSVFDSSNYMLNQKNIWTIKYNGTNKYLLKVFNNDVPFIFDASGNYQVIVESYDSYGNITKNESIFSVE